MADFELVVDTDHAFELSERFLGDLLFVERFDGPFESDTAIDRGEMELTFDQIPSQMRRSPQCEMDLFGKGGGRINSL